MANQEHINELQKGIPRWNRWRKAHPKIKPDLSGANFSRADLSGANFSRANLSGANLRDVNLRDVNLSRANLSGADLSRANLSGADLSGANFSRTDLISANLSGANLSGADLSGADLSRTDLISANFSRTDLISANLSRANLSGANLISANFSRANLNEANLSRADLNGADLNETNLNGADLNGADLSEAIASGTIFGECDLQNVKGLEMVKHGGPSHLTINTIYKSKGNIPEIFLRGTGADDTFIEYMRSLTAKPIEYYTCFISYSSKDEDFAQRLYTDLQSHGIRCWFAPHSLKPGDYIRKSIDEAIRLYDKLILLLSESSVQSTWVSFEVEAAMDKEHEDKPPVLFPLRLDETVMESTTTWARHLKRTRQIGDFTFWKDYDAYQNGLKQLLNDLKNKSTKK